VNLRADGHNQVSRSAEDLPLDVKKDDGNAEETAGF